MEMTNTTSPTGTAGISPFAAVVKMFYEPTRTFELLKPKSHAWLPLILVTAAIVGLFMWYFSVVDNAWLLEQFLNQMKASERAAMEDTITIGSFKTMLIGGQLFGMPVMCALVGLYLMIASKVVKRPMNFGESFALSAWAFIPSLLLLPLAAIQILMSTNPQFDPSALNMLSVNALFFQYPMGHPYAALFDSIGVTSIWTVFLFIIGFHVWTKAPMATAVKVILLPYAVIYGIWIAVAMGTAAA